MGKGRVSGENIRDLFCSGVAYSMWLSRKEHETVPLTDEIGSPAAFLLRSAVGQDRKDENRSGSHDLERNCNCEGLAQTGGWNCRGDEPGGKGILQ